MLLSLLWMALPPLVLGQLDTNILERLLDYGAIGILTIIGWSLFFQTKKENGALRDKLETQGKEFGEKLAARERENSAELRTLVVNANTGNDRTADALEATKESLSVIAVEFRRNNDARGLPRTG